MPSVGRSLRIMGPGSSGVRFDMDEFGLKDEAGRVFTPTVEVTWPVTATMAASYIWRCHRGIWQVEDVEADLSVSGGAGALLDVLVCTGAPVAPASGVSQLTGTLSIQATAPFRVRGVLIATPTPIVPGDCVAVNMGGTMTGAVGVLTVILRRTQL